RHTIINLFPYTTLFRSVENDVESVAYTVPFNARLKVTVGDNVTAGQELTEGSIDPKELLRIQGVEGVQAYLLQEVQRVYRMQGVEIGDKHVEVRSEERRVGKE